MKSDLDTEIVRISSAITNLRNIEKEKGFLTLEDFFSELDFRYANPTLLKLKLHEEVFVPLECSLILCKHLENISFGDVLEIGCGTGIGSIIIKNKQANLTAIDINKEAIALTKRNLELNNLSSKRIFLQDVQTLKSFPYDTIVANAPFVHEECPAEIGGGIRSAMYAEKNGNALIFSLFSRLDQLLSPCGTLFVTFSTDNYAALSSYALSLHLSLEVVEAAKFGNVNNKQLVLGKVRRK